MTARSDLENAFSILDAGINAHVTALAVAKAAVADESYLVELTAKVIAFADTLAASHTEAPIAVVPAAVIPDAVKPADVVAPAPLPAFLLPPEAQQAAQVAQVLPVVEAPVADTVLPAFPEPSVLETMEAAVRAMVAKANPPA